MSKIIENIKSGNYEVVDNQGVSVTQHFIDCLEKEFADLEAKLAESEKKYDNRKEFCISQINSLKELINNLLEENAELKQQLAEKEKEIEELKEITNSVIVPRRLTKTEIKQLFKQQTLTAIIELEKVIDVLDKNYWDISFENWNKSMAKVQTYLAERIKQLREGN